MERRLTAILAADVVGYSRLMEADEAGTLERLKTYYHGLIEPKIIENHGRTVKLMGDGILVEFASVVDAVTCAISIQRTMAERTAEESEDRRFSFRIGVNLGDVIVDGDDIYGNGINIAARLESLAEPGGICISGRVFDQVERNVEAGFSYLGPQAVKNIERPVNAYRVLLGPEDVGKVLDGPKTSTRATRWLVATILILGLAGGGLGLYSHFSNRGSKMAVVGTEGETIQDAPSIAVLPFDNFSDDPQLDFFAIGLTENLTSSLSKAPGLFVIARNSAASYKGKAVDVKQIVNRTGFAGGHFI